MTKKSLGFFLLLCLIFSLTACSSSEPSAQEDASSVVIPLPEGGVSFRLPKEMQDIEGLLVPTLGYELERGSGLYISGLLYAAMSKEKYQELAAKGNNLSQEDIDFVSSRIFEYVLVYGIDGNRNQQDLETLLTPYGLPYEGCKEIGTVGEYRFFYLLNPVSYLFDNAITFDEGFREEYDRLVQLVDSPDWIEIQEPLKQAMGEAGSLLSFETVDLDGNPVRSEDIFSQHQLTMVNIWGTYCGPCIQEMPDLEVLNQRLADKNCAIIGILCDVYSPEDATAQTAHDIISDTGVTYLNLLPWDGWSDALPAQFIPTTYFVDSQGRLVGEAAIGARGADDYEALIDEILSSLTTP